MRPHFGWIVFPALVGLWGCGSLPSDAPAPTAHRQVGATDYLPGATADGAIRLPNQWFLRPVGKQFVVGDFPRAISRCIPRANSRPCCTRPRPKRDRGARIARRKDHFARAGSRDILRTHIPPDGKKIYRERRRQRSACTSSRSPMATCRRTTRFRSETSRQRGVPSGLAVTADGKALYVANVWGTRLSLVDLASRDRSAKVTRHHEAPSPRPNDIPRPRATTKPPSRSAPRRCWTDASRRSISLCLRARREARPALRQLLGTVVRGGH